MNEAHARDTSKEAEGMAFTEEMKTCRRCDKTKLLRHFKVRRRVRRDEAGQMVVKLVREQYCNACDLERFHERMRRSR